MTEAAGEIRELEYHSGRTVSPGGESGEGGEGRGNTEDPGILQTA